MIKMSKVFKEYAKEITALDDINVTIDQGEFVYVVGPSGAGKSTFVKMIYREELPSTGEIVVGGKNVNQLKKKEVPLLRRQVGVVFQDFKLLPRLTVYENVAYAMEVLEKESSVIKQRVNEVLELVGLQNKTEQFPSELSGGEEQRVAIARAVANTPQILIADEPTGNLDPDTAWEIVELLEEINRQGATVIMATHNAEIVNKARHRVIAIEKGKIVRDEEKGGYDYER